MDELQSDRGATGSPPPHMPPRAPLWVYVFVALLASLMVVVVALHITMGGVSGHGFGAAGGQR